MSDNDSIRVLALDLDGTIITHNGRISDRSLAAIAAFRDTGREVLIASGRSRRSAMPWATRIGRISGMICHNGAAVYDFRDDDQGREIAVTLLPETVARRVVELSREFDLHFHAFRGESWCYEKARPGTSVYEGRTGFKGELVDFDDIPVLGFYKAMFIAAPGPEIDEAAEAVRALCGDAATVFFSGPGFLEIVAASVSKASGLESWLHAAGYGLGEVLALGDAENDEAMLLEAGIGIAMGNAPADLRERIGRVTGTIDDDGAAGAIERFLAGLDPALRGNI